MPYHWWVGWLAVLAMCGVAVGQDADPKRAAAVKEVAESAQRLKQAEKLFAQQALEEQDVLAARYQAVDAKYQLGLIDGEPQHLLMGHVRQLVVISHEYHDLMKRLLAKGRVAVVDLDSARLGLAEAQIRLETHVIVDIHERNVGRLEKLLAQKIGTAEQVQGARKALEEARRRLAELPR